MDKKIALEIAIEAVRRRKTEVQQQYRLRLREFDEAILELEKMRESLVRVVADDFSEEAVLVSRDHVSTTEPVAETNFTMRGPDD